MCGIYGYVGPRPLTQMLLQGLERLEYRGYDSAGIAVLPRSQKIGLGRAVGRVGRLREKLAGTPVASAADGLGLAHTRWATHGPAEERNAHPHLDCGGELAVVHNGIIENHDELRRALAAEGHVFRSDTDSEVVSHLIESHYRGDLVEAVRIALPLLRGSFALGVIHNGSEPEKIVAARAGSPLTIGIGDGEAFLSSDVAPMLEHTRRVVYLDEGDLAVITRSGAEVFDRQFRRVTRELVEIDWSTEAAEKGGYEHFMRKEIAEQPEVIRRTLVGRIGVGSPAPVRLPELDRLIREGGVPERILITACGTSYHAGLLAKPLIERSARIPVEVDVASEVRYRDPMIDARTLMIVVSQSGETADTLAAMRLGRDRGARVLAICNVVGSTIAREADAVLMTQAGPEIGVASTKAFTTQIVLLQCVSFALALARGTLSSAEAAVLASSMSELPEAIELVLEQEPAIESLARRFRGSRAFLFLGRGDMFPIALEGALKLKEITYVPAEGYPAGEMKHGPIALVDATVPSIFLVSNGATHEKVLANMEEIAARSAPVVAFIEGAEDRVARITPHTVVLPRLHPAFAPVMHAVAVQLFSYHVARALERDIDRPRNLAKSVTVE